MSNVVTKTPLGKEVVESGLQLNRVKSGGTNLWLLKNHGKTDLSISLKINNTSGAPVVTPNPLIEVVDSNIKFTSENPSKKVNKISGNINCVLKADPSITPSQRVGINIRNENGISGYELLTIDGKATAKDFSNNAYLYAQQGLGCVWEDSDPSSGYDVYFNLKTDNEPLVLQLKELPNIYGGPMLSQEYSYFDNQLPLSSGCVDYRNKRIVIPPITELTGNFVNTEISGYMDKAFTDPDTGKQMIHIGYAFKVPNYDKVFTTVVTVDAPFLGIYVDEEYVDATEFFSENLRNDPEFMALPEASKILDSIEFYAWDGDEVDIYGGFEGLNVSDFINKKGNKDINSIANASTVEVLILPEYEISHPSGFPVLNLGKDTSDYLAEYLGDVHRDYRILAVCAN